MSDKQTENAMSCLMTIIGVPVLLAFNVFYGGLAIMLSWNWFAVPALAVPHVSYMSAIGLDLVVSSFITIPAPKSPKEETTVETFSYAFARILVANTMVILVGLIVHAFR